MNKSDAWSALEMGALRVLVAVGISAAAYKLISPKGKSTNPLDSARRGAAWGTFSALTTTLPEVLHTFSPQAWLKLGICLIVTVIFGFLMGFAIGSIRFWKRKPKIDKTSSETGESRKVESDPHAEFLVQERQDIYTVVADEIESKNVDRGLWARAFEEADGDGEKTKAAYIRLRVDQSREISSNLKQNPQTSFVLISTSAALILAIIALIGLLSGLFTDRPNPEVIYAEGMKQLELKDETKASELFLQAASRGSPRAQWKVGSMHMKGVTVHMNGGDDYPQNEKEGLKWITKAAEGGLPEAQFYLGLSGGSETKESLEEHIRWCRMAAEQGFAPAQYRLSLYYKDNNDILESAIWSRKAAIKGFPEAQKKLAFLYDNGLGVPQDEVQAAIWYRKAAEQGDMFAQETLGQRYQHGNGVTKNTMEAVLWYRKAAEKGNESAAVRLSRMYCKGEGVAVDVEESMKWVFTAAKNGNAAAKRWCMEEAEKGDGRAQAIIGSDLIIKDPKEAVKWLRKSAAQGDARGQTDLGGMYFNGGGVEKDHKEAFNLWYKAAEQGNANAQCSLGYLYEEGDGVTKDDAEALKWFKRAAAQGNESAIKRLTD